MISGQKEETVSSFFFLIVYGELCLLYEDQGNVFSYIRIYKEEKLLVILNFLEAEVEFKVNYNDYYVFYAPIKGG